jgi:hypothetical protein
MFLVLCLACLSQSSPAAERADPLRHGHALIIGTWVYSDSRWPRLDDIDLQMQELKNGLQSQFDDVQVLRNPRFDRLDSGLRGFLRSYGNDPGARLLVYYAGHGYTEPDLHRNEFRGYITASDTPYVDGSQLSLDKARVRAISMEAVRGMVSDVNALQVLFIFDSCFAGTVFTARSPADTHSPLTDADIARLIQLPVREFITAGDINQRVPAHSPLPQLVLNALSGAADPYGLGVITGQQLAQYLWSQTVSMGLSPREGKLPGGYFDQGEFFFRVSRFNANVPVNPTVETPVPITPSFNIPEPTDRLAIGRWAIQTGDGLHFLTADKGGGLAGAATAVSTASTTPGVNETFELIIVSGDPKVDFAGTKFALRTSRGYYLTAVSGLGWGNPNFPIHTDASWINGWETFTLAVNWAHSPPTVTIGTWNGNYLSAVDGGGIGAPNDGAPIHSNVKIGPSASETFSVVRTPL